MSYQIRPAQVEDADRLKAYMGDLFTERLPVLYSRASLPNYDEVVLFINQHVQTPAALLLVVVKEGRIVGMVDAVIHKHDQRSHCASFGMSVLSNYRRQGIGGALLLELLFWAKQCQLKRIELEVFSSNGAAIALYKKVGFVVEGTKKAAVQIDSAFVDVLLMAYFIA